MRRSRRTLAHHLGPRLDQRSRIAFPYSPMRMAVVLLIVALGLGLYLLARSTEGRYFLGFSFADALTTVLSRAAMVVIPLWLLLEVLDVIPRGYAEKTKKVAWGKDQSWRRPF